ncbi:iron oxidase [Brachionus plicatilis]|uniref:Iron oxidase n=1 Tax=Brachionus plicatilis TaxID=10195 RepID=A0A3M7SBM1_BRAPC|nr:iron oxidase [Brachionus plicatilis]
MATKIPVIDISALVNETDQSDKLKVANELNKVCSEHGFFYIVGHGVDAQLQQKLENLSRQFFNLPLETKLKIKRNSKLLGYFTVGTELTYDKPDHREGLWLGEELDPEDDLVKRNVPLHGPNSFPEEVPELRPVVLEYMNKILHLAHKLINGLALSLGLSESYFYDRYTKRPFYQLGIAHYPPVKVANESLEWGIGEHTDYGLLTILKQDNNGGLQIKPKSSDWIDAPPIENSFICNIGDMMDRITGGLYKSTLHRVKVQTKKDRISFPFFFEPSFFSRVTKIEGLANSVDDKDQRWDKMSVYDFDGTYGEYLMTKVFNALPDLKSN